MNRFVIVTGGGRGLGLSIVRRHLDAGDRVLALIHRSADALKALKRTCPNLSIAQCDVADSLEVAKALSPLTETGQTIDIIYNAAGINLELNAPSLEVTDLDKCMLMYQVNTLGPLRVITNVLPLLSSGAVIVNVSSESGSITDCRRKAEYGYCMSKAALNMNSRLLQNQLEGTDIRVFSYHPGWLKTDMGGEGARLSSFSITPEESADVLMDITSNPSQFPKDVLFIDYKKNPLPW